MTSFDIQNIPMTNNKVNKIVIKTQYSLWFTILILILPYKNRQNQWKFQEDSELLSFSLLSFKDCLCDNFMFTVPLYLIINDSICSFVALPLFRFMIFKISFASCLVYLCTNCFWHKIFAASLFLLLLWIEGYKWIKRWSMN